jgi:hypothetical protein
MILNAKSYLISNIPLPKTYIQNLDPYPCNEECLQELLDNEMVLSFMAHADKQLDDSLQDEIRMMSISILNLGSQVSNKLKIALLLPYKKIGRYAASTTNASFAYLLTRNQYFDLKTYNIESESAYEIKNAIMKIRDDGFGYIIAPFTTDGAETLISLRPDQNIYFPTINKHDVNSSASNIYFGGIDYKAQTDMLLKEAVSPLVVFYDNSDTGSELAKYQEETFMFEHEEERNVVKFLIPRRTTNLEEQLLDNENINQGSFFINTPIVKSSMIISQLTMYDTNATNVLSTQINYDPLILTLTQFDDRDNMVIANSITQNNSVFIETNALLGNDIVYDWINYTTTVGIDYFFNRITKQARHYKIEVEDNQMQYPIELLQPSKTRFIKYFSNLEKVD